MISVYAVDLYIIKPYKLGSFATVTSKTNDSFEGIAKDAFKYFEKISNKLRSDNVLLRRKIRHSIISELENVSFKACDERSILEGYSRTLSYRL